MADPINFENSEPVPAISQLCALPFVAAIAGHLLDGLGLEGVRVTLHRVMNRDGSAYLQQLCAYGTYHSELDHSTAGRIFASTAGIIGKAFRECRIVRTCELPSEDAWWTAYRQDRQTIGETGPELKHVTSYLALPMLDGTGTNTVCVLFVDAHELNAFTDPGRIAAVVAMSKGFCRMIDGLVRQPLPRVRNYGLPPGKPHEEAQTAYPKLQEIIADPAPPRFEALNSFNFAAAP